MREEKEEGGGRRRVHCPSNFAPPSHHTFTTTAPIHSPEGRSLLVITTNDIEPLKVGAIFDTLVVLDPRNQESEGTLVPLRPGPSGDQESKIFLVDLLSTVSISA